MVVDCTSWWRAHKNCVSYSGGMLLQSARTNTMPVPGKARARCDSRNRSNLGNCFNCCYIVVIMKKLVLLFFAVLISALCHAQFTVCVLTAGLFCPFRNTHLRVSESMSVKADSPYFHVSVWDAAYMDSWEYKVHSLRHSTIVITSGNVSDTLYTNDSNGYPTITVFPSDTLLITVSHPGYKTLSEVWIKTEMCECVDAFLTKLDPSE